jgi:DNA-binding MarR family transcriptional regulator
MEFEHTIPRKVGLLWHRLSQHLGNQLKEAGADITPDQFRLLTQLWKMDGCNQLHLSRLLGRDRSAITRMVSVLEKKGLLKRSADDSDARVNRIYLTREGKSLRHLAEQSAVKTLDQALAGFSREEAEVFKAMLEKMAQNLR